jgi:ketosteroid isomerase-like protein
MLTKTNHYLPLLAFLAILQITQIACQTPDAASDLKAAKAHLHKVNETYGERFRKNDIAWYASHYAKDACIMPEKMPAICGIGGIRDYYFNGGQNASLHIEIRVKEITGGPEAVVEEGIYEISDAANQRLDAGKFIAIWVAEDGAWKLRREIWTTDLSAAPGLKITFIGNAAFEITDGQTTLLTDYPYVSGAFGYMPYDPNSVQPQGRVLSLITHEHDDHFSPALFAATDWHLAASPRVEAKTGNGKRLPFSASMTFETIRIFPVKSPHTDAHHSYLIEWHGKRFFFTGDTESLDVLPKERVDVLFITPWLLDSARKRQLPLNAGKIVIHHHRGGEKIACENCLVPKQGEQISL